MLFSACKCNLQVLPSITMFLLNQSSTLTFTIMHHNDNFHLMRVTLQRFRDSNKENMIQRPNRNPRQDHLSATVILNLE